MPYFGFKAKQRFPHCFCGLIVLCLILDSRQNIEVANWFADTIVLCLILDSRQNSRSNTRVLLALYCALFWIQGKTVQQNIQHDNDCTVPYFGFKAKLHLVEGRTALNCTVPYFGFKAKQSECLIMIRRHCTVPYFGFKAKPENLSACRPGDCTVPYFGFKAKQLSGNLRKRQIVLCLILDSRQNGDEVSSGGRVIVLCLILDSRQNRGASASIGDGLYCALFWIQGKTEP